MNTSGDTGVERPKRVLFVCSGNICRSPTAEGIARHVIRERGCEGLIEVESAGTHGYHAGEPPDPRALSAALARGYDLSSLRARRLEVADFDAFDLVLAMDAGHMAIMRRMCPEVHQGKLEMFMRYARSCDLEEVPDPYYGNPAGFEAVLGCCEDAVHGLIETLARR